MIAESKSIMPSMFVEFKIKVPIKTIKRKNIYVTCCSVLDICSQGKNEKEAIENIKDAINLFLISCFERGVLDKALKECGFVPERGHVHRLSSIPNTKTIDVPLYLISSGKAIVRCHA